MKKYYGDGKGIVIYHVAAGKHFKRTLDKDEEPKGKAVAA